MDNIKHLMFVDLSSNNDSYLYIMRVDRGSIKLQQIITIKPEIKYDQLADFIVDQIPAHRITNIVINCFGQSNIFADAIRSKVYYRFNKNSKSNKDSIDVIISNAYTLQHKHTIKVAWETLYHFKKHYSDDKTIFADREYISLLRVIERVSDRIHNTNQEVNPKLPLFMNKYDLNSTALALFNGLKLSVEENTNASKSYRTG